MSRTRTALLAALALVAGRRNRDGRRPGDAGVPPSPAPSTTRCRTEWDTGFTAAVTVTNNGAAKSPSWSLKWSYAGQPAGHPAAGTRRSARAVPR